jgi:glycosyltransferase involved in cell wall biosynthesis
MRLAILTSHPIQYYAPLFRELAGRIDLHVFFAHQATPAEQAAAGFGHAFSWDVELLQGFEHSFLRNVASDPSAARFSGCDTPEIGACLRAGRFDAVLALGWHLKSLLQGVWAAKRLGIQTMVRGDSQLATPRSAAKRMLKTLAYPPFLRMFDAALYVGARNKAYYEHYGFPAERLFRSPHCVETRRFSDGATNTARNALRARLGVSTGEKVALFAGKLIEFKRPLDVVEAVANARKIGADARVLVAGAGALEAPLRYKADELGVCLDILGFQNQSAMPAAYAAADALMLPSTAQETWGLVCNEALASGLPIVVSDAVGCAPDLAGDGQVGRIFPLGDTRAGGDALAKLFKRPPARVEIDAVSRRYSLAAAADGVLEALAEVTTPRSRSRRAVLSGQKGTKR